MFKELDVVRLKASDAETGVSTQDVGTIVLVLSDGVYMVEFMDADQTTNEAALDKAYYESELDPA